MKRLNDEYLMRRANAMRNILQGETGTIGEAATIAWLVLAGFALDAAEGSGRRAAEAILAESAELADDLSAGRLTVIRPN